MHQHLTADDVDQAGRSEPQSVEHLYARAFSEHGARCLWSWKRIANPSPGHARVIARALRSEGDRSAWELSWEIEDACDAADRPST